jgi:hypothetical protein
MGERQGPPPPADDAPLPQEDEDAALDAEIDESLLAMTLHRKRPRARTRDGGASSSQPAQPAPSSTEEILREVRQLRADVDDFRGQFAEEREEVRQLRDDFEAFRVQYTEGREAQDAMFSELRHFMRSFGSAPPPPEDQ